MINQEYFYNLPSLQGKLKPIVCPSCRDNRESVGSCKKCLENQAWNTEWLETHAFEVDKVFRPYHYYDHQSIKALPLRLPNEHPYRYDGIEIEVEFDKDTVYIYEADDDGYDYDDNWKINDILAEFTKICPLFVYEHDGSLRNGVELISRPTSYAYWTHPDTIKMLREGFDYLKSQGALEVQPITNGMHIHTSKKFFDRGAGKVGGTEAFQDMDWLFQKFQPQIELFGGRKYTEYCSSRADDLKRSVCDKYLCNRFNAEIESKITLKKGGNVPAGDHHVAVNMSGATIEARVFKSTLDVEEIIANIELMRNFSHAVRDGLLEGATFNELLHTKDNLYLDKHLQKVRMECAKNKQILDLDEVNTDELEVSVSTKTQN